MNERANERIVVGISGASGAVIGVRLLAALRRLGTHETHLIVSASGAVTAAQELGLTRGDLDHLADVVHNVRDIGAAVASGSFLTAGMVIAPCSMKTLAGVANGFADNLLTRAADVMLKGAPPPRAGRARDAAQPRASAQHDARNRDGRDRDAACTRVLRAFRRQSTTWSITRSADSGFVRHRASRDRAPLERSRRRVFKPR